MKKILITISIFLFVSLNTFANEIDKYIFQNDFELKSTISIFARNGHNVIYKKNSQKLLNPASVLKPLTFGAGYLVLGEDYEFKTSIYKDSSNNYYLKLGGDTLLTTDDLTNLFSKINVKEINNLYIDDFIIDKIPYPNGWMQDDMFPNMRAVTPYIIDNNYSEIAIKRSSLATNVDIIQNDFYKIPIINNLKLGDKQEYKIERLYGEESSVLGFSGTIVKDEIITLPVLKPEINFDIKLRRALNKAQIKCLNKITVKKVPEGAKEISFVSHTIDEISKNILLNSDNFASEVVFKVAAAQYINYEHPASLDDAIRMFYEIFKQELTEGIKITDASGVSRYNLVNSEFVVGCLDKLFKNEKYKNLLATANQGTLKDRLIFLENNLRAKTGTLANMSSIAGTLTSKSGDDITFAIIIQNSPKRKAILKNFENNVITILYRKY
ncbi:D-alanyl-D-alanine carboxypeptidase/D-alanyl-D-alanine-endopeptidase [bacterium]|nr:D-alanyl-D-alanine carboxypeptidase/D-alanyl-D-alanine-endopeptidase [bacterium]